MSIKIPTNQELRSFIYQHIFRYLDGDCDDSDIKNMIESIKGLITSLSISDKSTDPHTEKAQSSDIEMINWDLIEKELNEGFTGMTANEKAIFEQTKKMAQQQIATFAAQQKYSEQNMDGIGE